jgi:hypothetical protein
VLVRVQARHPDRVLHGIGTTVGEEDLRHIRAREFDDPLRRFAALVVRVLRRDGRDLRGLLLDSSNDLRVLVPDVDVHQLRGEVQPLVAVVVPDVRAFRGRDAHRIECTLRTPRVEHVLTIEVVDALAFFGIWGIRHTCSSSLSVVIEA